MSGCARLDEVLARIAVKEARVAALERELAALNATLAWSATGNETRPARENRRAIADADAEDEGIPISDRSLGAGANTPAQHQASALAHSQQTERKHHPARKPKHVRSHRHH